MDTLKITAETPIAMCTVGQLVGFLSEQGFISSRSDVTKAVHGAVGTLLTKFDRKEDEQKPAKTRYIYGLHGICHEFHCSKSKAQKLKKEVFPSAVMQDKRSIMVDADLAWKLYREECARQKRAGANIQKD